jgi:hypothetical protein
MAELFRGDFSEEVPEDGRRGPLAGRFAQRFNRGMPALTRKRVNDRPVTWHVHYAGVRVGVIVERSGAPPSSDQWEWHCGFYPGSNPGDDRHGTAATFEAARAAFEAAWRDFLPKRSEADFEEWRDQGAWTAEKYRRFDRHERIPPDWRAGG